MGALLVIAVPAAGCGGLSSTGPPAVSEAVSQVKDDGFSVQVTGAERNTFGCDGHWFQIYSVGAGVPSPPGAIAPTYILTVNDPAVRSVMSVIALPTATDAARCAAAGLYSAQHGTPSVQTDPNVVTTPFPHTMFSPISIRYTQTPPSARAEIDTYLASGRLLLLGLSHGERQAALTERDLRKLAGQIGQ
jgi:hypothetical protein